jgi:hypothetical protein
MMSFGADPGWRNAQNSSFRHCERSEAIHGTAKPKLDRFVACASRNDGRNHRKKKARIKRAFK